MEKVKPKIVVIVGPTSSGKSAAAINLAKKFNGEIISADSRQVFKGMDLGTGKVKEQLSVFSFQLSEKTVREKLFISEEIPHYLIDVVDPMEDFNISHFKKLTNEAIEKILQKGKLPIICGGTGFWIDAIVKNTNIPEVEPDFELRKKLEQKSLEELSLQLEKLDPQRARNIDKKNKVRLIRAIEICKKLGKVPEHETWSMEHAAENSKYRFLQIGITTEREVLNEKIKKRLDERFEQGMINEVENLRKVGVRFEWMEKIGLEYRWIARYLQEKISLNDMKEKLYFDSIHYAKRQMTWFKRNKQIIWLKEYTDIEKEVRTFIKT
ncbi:MAG: tRNA delta(2)-isopentenylpyrophosphate transferase [uncultured bacterium]|nr:MAG: tRNA delta(2)-isopentenylpyrophosphate transferase [uncultured bacterium]